MEISQLLDACSKGIKGGLEATSLFNLDIRGSAAVAFFGCSIGIGAEYLRLNDAAEMDVSPAPLDLQKDLPSPPKL